MIDFTNSKFFYTKDNKTKTHIHTDLGNYKFIMFPINSNNATYQEYLEWVAKGNPEAKETD